MKILRLTILLFFMASTQSIFASNISTVKNGFLKIDESVSIGDAIDNWKACKDGVEWREFTTDNNKDIVEAKCFFLKNDISRSFVIQFAMSKAKSDEFKLDYTGISVSKNFKDKPTCGEYKKDTSLKSHAILNWIYGNVGLEQLSLGDILAIRATIEMIENEIDGDCQRKIDNTPEGKQRKIEEQKKREQERAKRDEEYKKRIEEEKEKQRKIEEEKQRLLDEKNRKEQENTLNFFENYDITKVNFELDGKKPKTIKQAFLDFGCENLSYDVTYEIKVLCDVTQWFKKESIKMNKKLSNQRILQILNDENMQIKAELQTEFRVVSRKPHILDTNQDKTAITTAYSPASMRLHVSINDNLICREHIYLSSGNLIKSIYNKAELKAYEGKKDCLYIDPRIIE
jgi:trichohyalin, putative